MHKLKRVNDAAQLYMNDIGARVVAESGRPSDRFHLGKLILRGLKDAPDFVLQIDAGTKQSETSGSVLERSVRCAKAMRHLGLGCGDVMVLMAPNHLNLAVPFYAALYVGVAIAPIDMCLTVKELQVSFSLIKPKLIFCQSEKAAEVEMAVNNLNSRARIVTFDDGDDYCNLTEFLDMYADDLSVDKFRASNFDPEDTISFLVSTSGSTGVPKTAALNHKNFVLTNPYVWSRFTKFPCPTRMFLMVINVQWLTMIANVILSPILRYTRLQSSMPLTEEHFVDMINFYRPTYACFGPTLMRTLIRGNNEKCDLRCFETIHIGGGSVTPELIDNVKNICPKTEVFQVYGLTELTSIAFHTEQGPPGSLGRPLECYQYRLVDPETQEDILKPNKPGELWMKGPIFKGYYGNPESTKEAFSVDGWLKCGDLFYRDENWYFYFVERIKMLLKVAQGNREIQISPVELENVIRQHPGVLDVVVVGVFLNDTPDNPCACIVRQPGFPVTAQEVVESVKAHLPESKQLIRGVVFVDKIPMTPTMKVNRRRLTEMAVEMLR